jgi:thiamine-phosphate pyrophosphorylase
MRADEVDWSLYVVIDEGLSGGRSAAAVLEAALTGGATAIQYREKRRETREALEVGGRLRERCRAAGVPFIVNDRVDWALALEADGVHLGPTDMPPAVARRLMDGRWIGASVDTPGEARAALADGADLISAGPAFATRSKLDTGPVLGPAGLRAIRAVVPGPMVAIGGITAANAAQVMGSGVDGISVITAVIAASDVAAAAAELREIVRQTSNVKRHASVPSDDV